MKFLFSVTAIVAGLVVLECAFISAESFTEGVRVSPETVTLKPGQYVWEPERAPEGPLLIVASITEQVAHVYRNGIRIARSSVSTGRQGHRTPTTVTGKAHSTKAGRVFALSLIGPATSNPAPWAR
jgi:hypothetical protein